MSYKWSIILVPLPFYYSCISLYFHTRIIPLLHTPRLPGGLGNWYPITNGPIGLEVNKKEFLLTFLLFLLLSQSFTVDHGAEPVVPRIHSRANEEHDVLYTWWVPSLVWQYGNNDDNIRWHYPRFDIVDPWPMQNDDEETIEWWEEDDPPTIGCVVHTSVLSWIETDTRVPIPGQVAPAIHNSPNKHETILHSDVEHDTDDRLAPELSDRSAQSACTQEPPIIFGLWISQSPIFVLWDPDKTEPSVLYKAVDRFLITFW